MANNHVVIFVEGETDEEFYMALLRYYKNNYRVPSSFQVVNLRGISRYERKLYAILKNQIIPKHHISKIKVICCYDTDVFDFAKKPPVNWVTVKQNLNSLGLETLVQVKAQKMIEDWFLKDLDGLCKYLKIKPPNHLEGNSGLEKIKNLFKKGSKIYQKGSSSHKFVQELSISIIREKIKSEVEKIERVLGLKPLK